MICLSIALYLMYRKKEYYRKRVKQIIKAYRTLYDNQELRCHQLQEKISMLEWKLTLKDSSLQIANKELVLKAVKKAMMEAHPDLTHNPNSAEEFMAYKEIYDDLRRS